MEHLSTARAQHRTALGRESGSRGGGTGASPPAQPFTPSAAVPWAQGAGEGSQSPASSGQQLQHSTRLQKGPGEPRVFAPLAPEQVAGMTRHRQGSSPRFVFSQPPCSGCSDISHPQPGALLGCIRHRERLRALKPGRG